MTRSELQTRVGYILVLGHITVVSLLIILCVIADSPFAQGEGTTAIALVVPIFATNTAAVLTHLIEQQKTRKRLRLGDQPQLSSEFVFYSFLFPGALVCFLLTTVVMKALTYIPFEQFKWMVAAAEGLFGIYTTQFVKALFEN